VSHSPLLLKIVDLGQTLSYSSPPQPFLFFLAHTTSFSCALDPSPSVPYPRTMAASHLEMFQKSTADVSKLLKIVENCFLHDREMLQWRPRKGEGIPTPNTNKIVLLSSFFNVDSAYPLLNSSTVFFITIRSS
jgi:hypothetical protein